MDGEVIPLYDQCNREERALCSHLFRLLLNSAHGNGRFLKGFLGLFADSGLCEPRVADAFRSLDDTALIRTRVYSEVTLIRDVLDSAPKFRDAIQSFCDAQGTNDTENSWQSRQLLCIKPDLAIVSGGALLVIEAKFILEIDPRQVERTKSLLQVWRKLEEPMKALGLSNDAPACVATLGHEVFKPTVSWQEVFQVAEVTLDETDPSYLALVHACALLRKIAKDHDDVTGYINCKGLSRLAETVAARPGGYVGFAGGLSGLRAALDDMDYLRDRPYKWLDSIESRRCNKRNWIPAETFLATVVSFLAQAGEDGCAQFGHLND